MSLALIQPELELMWPSPSPGLKFCEVLDWAFSAISPPAPSLWISPMVEQGHSVGNDGAHWLFTSPTLWTLIYFLAQGTENSVEGHSWGCLCTWVLRYQQAPSGMNSIGSLNSPEEHYLWWDPLGVPTPVPPSRLAIVQLLSHLFKMEVLSFLH